MTPFRHFVFFLCILGFLAPGAGAEEIAVTAQATLIDDLWVEVGGAAIGKFSLELRPSIRRRFPCSSLFLEATAANPAENWRKPANEAKIQFRPLCLRCPGESTLSWRFRSGSLTGDGLAGAWLEELMVNSRDLHGLSLKKGALGMLRGAVSAKPEDCFESAAKP